VPLRAVVFDFDGVIVDSEPLHFRALHDALAPDGVRITEDEYWSTYLAYDDREAIRLAFERHGESAAPERLAAAANRKVQAFARLIPEIPVFPGARELVRALAESRVPLAIASGARHAEIEAILAAIGLRQTIKSDKGPSFKLPAAAVMGTFGGDSVEEVRSSIGRKVQSIFKARSLRGTFFVVASADWACAGEAL